MAKTIQVSVDTSDLKVLNAQLNTTKKTINMTAKSAKTDFKSLKMAIDPVYRAEKLFTQQVLVAQKAVATGAISNSEYSRTFAMIQKNAQASGMTLNQFGQVANVNTRKMKRFGAVGMQQVGYQVQDFAVQVQGGTSAMVALGQQGSQLLGIFGPAGAIAGAILAVGTGLVGAFMASKKAGDESITTAKMYKDAMKESTEAVRSLKDENYMLANSYKSVSVAKLTQALNQIKQEKAEKEDFNKKKIADNRRQGQGAGLFKADLGDTKMSFFGDTYDEAIAKLESQIKKTQDLFDKNLELTLKKKTAEDLVKQNEEQDKFLVKLDRQLLNTINLESRKGAELLAAKQINEMRDFEVSLLEMGLKVGEQKYIQAVLTKELEQESIARAFYKLQIEKEAEEAKKIQQKKQLERFKALQKEAKKLNKITSESEQIGKAIANSFDSAMTSMVDGTKSVKDAFKSMTVAIIKDLYKIFIVKKITGMITSAFDGGDAALSGPQHGGGRANGGPVQGGRSYTVGERGPETFTPAMSGTITPNSGGSGGGTTIVQNINVSTGVQQTVRAEIRQMMPQIADSAKGAVLDAKRRGGSYGRAMA
tara:strand:- start:16412 stop:18187 length:1776 start_codon:yes stop_codon:yes gene_type:complete